MTATRENARPKLLHRAGRSAARGAILAALLTAGALASCGDPPLEPLGDGISELTVRHRGFEIFTQLTPGRASRGDTVRVLSHIVRVDDGPATIQARHCTLDVQTDFEFPIPGGVCLAHSGQYTLLPGDTVTQKHWGVVDWPRGEHEILVRHMLQPSRWVRLTLVVE